MLHADAAAVRGAAAPLAAWAAGLARVELKGLRAEGKLTQRFRAGGSLAVLRAAEQLLLDVTAITQGAADQAPQLLDEVRAAMAEVEPMAAVQDDNDELDEEI